jgi:hypothetical protein
MIKKVLIKHNGDIIAEMATIKGAFEFLEVFKYDRAVIIIEH